MPRPDLSRLAWPRQAGRLDLRPLTLDGTWLDDNTWALLREEWRG